MNLRRPYAEVYLAADVDAVIRSLVQEMRRESEAARYEPLGVSRHTLQEFADRLAAILSPLHQEQKK